MTTTSTQPPATGRARTKRRGFETATDMVRSLGLILLIVVPMWFLAQPGDQAEQEIRVVDQSGDVAAWTAATPGAPVPVAPAAWTPTVSQYDGAAGLLRLGWNTPARQYAEYAASTGGGQQFVADLVGTDDGGEPLDVGGVTWQRYADDDGSVSLVREVDGVTVVVGTRRATVPQDELAALAGTVTASR